jgi:tRNA 2-thiouridine synthesizing protein E
MLEIIQNNTSVIVDDDGFLTKLEGWTEEVARVLAAGEGIRDLSREQLDILQFLRTYYRSHAFFPILRAVCGGVHQPCTCIADWFIDPVAAWKIAGLPNPGEEVIGYRSWKQFFFSGRG